MRLIDADALLEKAKQEQRFYKDEYDAMESGYLDEERKIVKEAYSTMTDCVSLINNAPTIDAKPIRHKRWIYLDSEEGIFECSYCKERVAYPSDYCPQCGAKMDGKEKKDEV